jgi:2-polyprenyl-3-methyl-5-hydroxy-6-metoxy-1,4-benzoquinol methylase
MPRTIDDARFWDRTARKYAADVIADPAGYERTLERTRQHLKAGDTVLEVGCGTGTTALRLAHCVARLVATDVSSEMIAIAREKAAAQGCANAAFEVARADAAEGPDRSFDAVLAFNVLHLVAEREAVLRNIHRLLKPGGLFISKTPCLAQMGLPVRLLVPVMQAIGKAPHVAFFTDAELEREIAAAGFKIVERARHGTRGKDTRPFLVARKRA